MLGTFKETLESIHELETDFVKILYYDLPKNLSEDYFSHNNMRLCTILEGEKNIKIKNKKFSYGKDNFLLLPSNSKVHMDIPVMTKALVFEINEELISSVINKINLEEEIQNNIMTNVDLSFFLGENSNYIKDDLYNLFSLFNDSNKNKEFLIDLYSQKLVYNLVTSKASAYILNNFNKNPIFFSIKYINENIENKINLEALANKYDMSLSQFSKSFKKHMNTSPLDYIINKKLEHSKSLLKNHSVTEVSFMMGYENISYFIKVFKKKYGLTPKQFKLKYF